MTIKDIPFGKRVPSSEEDKDWEILDKSGGDYQEKRGGWKVDVLCHRWWIRRE